MESDKSLNQTNKQINDIVYAIINARKKRNITQEELSALTGVPNNTIFRFEECISTPSLPVLINLANAFGMSLILKET